MVHIVELNMYQLLEFRFSKTNLQHVENPRQEAKVEMVPQVLLSVLKSEM